MKVLRLTRHGATPEQLDELRRIFGDDCVVTEVSETVPDAARVTAICAEYGADVLEAVLPLPLMAEVVNPRTGVGIPVIRAITNRMLDASGEKAIFAFSHYEKVIKVEVVTERL